MPDPPPGPETIARARAGDEGACRELVEALYAGVARVVARHLPRRDEHEDLCQEVFMKLFAKLDTYAGAQPIDHWAKRIATHTCYDRLRRQRVRPEFNFAELGLDEAEFLERALSGDPEPAGDAGREAASGLLERLFESLNPREQIAVRLLDIDQLSVQECCNQTGWSASKVKVTALRGRRKLKAALERLEAGRRGDLAAPVRRRGDPDPLSQR